MWAKLNNKDYHKFFEKYSDLAEFENELILYKTEEYVLLPKLFVKNYSSFITPISDKSFVEENSEITFTGTPKDKQKEIGELIHRVHSKYGRVGGIIKAVPGFGKTVLSVYISSLLKKRTLVIVDNTKLLEQWKETIINFTNIKEEDIGIIMGKHELKPKPIYIAMVQTLLSKVKTNIHDYYSKFKKLGIGLIFVDECHKTSSSEQFVKSSLLFNTESIIGLSATPYVSALHEILLKNTIGSVIYDDKSYDLTPTVNFVYYYSGITKHKPAISYLHKTDFLKAKGMYNKVICGSTIYPHIIKNICADILESNENSRVIIIAFTQKQVKLINDYLQKSGIDSIPFYSKQRVVDKENNRVLVATYAYASHGFDYKQLSDIILATPLIGRKSLIQCIGRILRTCEGKNNAHVYDLIDLDCDCLFLNNIAAKKKILNNEFGCKFTIKQSSDFNL